MEESKDLMMVHLDTAAVVIFSRNQGIKNIHVRVRRKNQSLIELHRDLKMD